MRKYLLVIDGWYFFLYEKKLKHASRGSKLVCSDMCFWRLKTDVVLRSQLRFHFAPSKMNDDVNDEEPKERRETSRESREDARSKTCFTFTSRTYPQCRVMLVPSYKMTNHRFGDDRSFSPREKPHFSPSMCFFHLFHTP